MGLALLALGTLIGFAAIEGMRSGTFMFPVFNFVYGRWIMSTSTGILIIGVAVALGGIYLLS